MTDKVLYRVHDVLFEGMNEEIGYGDYDYTDRNPKRSSENAWFWHSILGGYAPREY